MKYKKGQLEKIMEEAGVWKEPLHQALNGITLYPINAAEASMHRHKAEYILEILRVHKSHEAYQFYKEKYNQIVNTQYGKRN